MKRAHVRVVVPGVALLVLAGCRGILGIEALQVEDDGGDSIATDDGGLSTKDGSSPVTDSGRDANALSQPDSSGPPPPVLPDGAPPSDSGCQYATGSTPCEPCCRAAFPAGYTDMEVAAINAGCLCDGDGGACESECGSAFCSNPQTMPPSGCNMCLDQALGGVCKSALTACNSADCINARSCLASCAAP